MEKVISKSTVAGAADKPAAGGKLSGKPNGKSAGRPRKPLEERNALKLVTFGMSRSMFDALENFSRETSAARSWVIRQAIKTYIEDRSMLFHRRREIDAVIEHQVERDSVQRVLSGIHEYDPAAEVEVEAGEVEAAG